MSIFSPNIKFEILIKQTEIVDFNKRTPIENTMGLTSFYY